MPDNQRNAASRHQRPTPPRRAAPRRRRAPTPPNNATPPNPAPRRLRRILDFAGAALHPPGNGRPHQPPPIYPPSHRDAVLPDCPGSGVPSTGLSIRTASGRPRRTPDAADASLRSLAALFAPSPPPLGFSAALSPRSRALSRSPHTTGALRPPCLTFCASPPEVSESGYSPRSS